MVTTPRTKKRKTTSSIGRGDERPSDNIDLLIERRAAKAHSSNTHATYSSGWNSYLKYCNILHIDPTPITEHKVCQYIAKAHASKQLLATSIDNYVDAIAHEASKRGQPNPTLSGKVAQLIKGCYRIDFEEGVRPKKAEEVSSDEIDLVLARLDLDKFEDVRFGLYLASSSMGATRASEQVMGNRTGVKLKWKNVLVIHATSGEIERLDLVQDTGIKNGQLDYETTVPLPRTNLLSCVVTWMELYRGLLTKSEMQDNGPVFIARNPLRPYSYKNALSDIKNYFRLAGIDKRVTTHTPRVSQSNRARKAGLSAPEIMDICRWRSYSSLLHYARKDPATTAKLVAKI